jgi:hypothetical protein
MRYARRAERSHLHAPVILAVIGLLLFSFSLPAEARTEEEWKERTVYQIVSAVGHNAV